MTAASRLSGASRRLMKALNPTLIQTAFLG
jgi:hypothetical protein